MGNRWCISLERLPSHHVDNRIIASLNSFVNPLGIPKTKRGEGRDDRFAACLCSREMGRRHTMNHREASSTPAHIRGEGGEE